MNTTSNTPYNHPNVCPQKMSGEEHPSWNKLQQYTT